MSRSETQDYDTECKREEAGSTKCAEVPEKRQRIGLTTKFWEVLYLATMSTEALREPRSTTIVYHRRSKMYTKVYAKNMLRSFMSDHQTAYRPQL